MRNITKAAIFMALLATILSCGGESSQETADSPETEAAVDTVITEEAVITTEVEELLETVETVIASPEGLWETTMGQMELVLGDSDNVTGEYPLGTIEGTLSGNIIEFTYNEGSLSGEGTFTFESDFNSFAGFQDISGTELIWDGRRL